MTGPGCSGALLSICSMNKDLIIPSLIARLGARAMLYWPFVHVGAYKQAERSDAGAVEGAIPIDASMVAAELSRNARMGCQYCLAECGQVEADDVWHLAFECGRPGLTPVREQMMSAVTGLLRKICDQLYRDVMWYRSTFESYEPHGPALIPVLATIHHTRTLLGPGLVWDTAPGRILMYHLLLVIPFPASLLGTVEAPSDVTSAIHGLGVMFDSVCIPRRFLKHISNMWTRWSHRWLMALADVRSGRAHEAPAAQALAPLAV